MRRGTMLDRVTWVLTGVGAVNWGLVGLAHFDLVKTLFGRDTLLTRMVYGLVGLSGVWSLYHLLSAITEAPELVRR